MQLFVELQTARSSPSLALDRAVNIINKYFDRFLAFSFSLQFSIVN
ncbi:MAG: hypothetical protein QNJ54_08400 [Prochloraceae cyanobacterium]|nr:hypothetical protein [Prochloraceae cyanobacterium]